MTQWTQEQWDAARDNVESLARGILSASILASADSSDRDSYLMLIQEISENIEQWTHSLRYVTVPTMAYLAEACDILAELVRALRGKNVHVPHLHRVPSAEAVDWLHDEGLYPLMFRALEDARGDRGIHDPENPI